MRGESLELLTRTTTYLGEDVETESAWEFAFLGDELVEGFYKAFSGCR